MGWHSSSLPVLRARYDRDTHDIFALRHRVDADRPVVCVRLPDQKPLAENSLSLRQRWMVNENESSQLKDLSYRIANERDPEKLTALVKELEQWIAQRRGDSERRKMMLSGQ